jgi:hypothetical protein
MLTPVDFLVEDGKEVKMDIPGVHRRFAGHYRPVAN